MQTNINKPDSDKDVLLKMVDIEKSFPGVKALDHAQLTVRRGTVHAYGRKRRGQVNSYEMPFRRLQQGRRTYMSTAKR